MRNPFALLSRYRERLRFRYGPQIAQWRLDRATARVRSTISIAAPLKVLIDNSVLDRAITHETEWISTGGRGGDVTGRGAGYAARVPVYGKGATSRDAQNVRYLTSIAHLCQSGHIAPFSSEELDDERIRQPAGRFTGFGYFDLNLFKGIRFETIGEPTLLVMGPKGFNLPSAKEQQIARMSQRRSVDRAYDLLVRRLGDKSSNDAWHILEAERNGMFCFLTMDYKLINSVRRQGKLAPLREMKLLVLTPEELGQSLGFKPIDPVVLSYKDASFFVRKDLSMPGGKRRRSVGYSSKPADGK